MQKFLEILAKVGKGEQLTDDERKALADFNPQKELDAAAAAARKKAEADAQKAADELTATKTQLAEATAKLQEASDKGKTDLQKMQEQVARLTADTARLTAERATLVRQAKLDDVIRTSGIAFVKEVDPAIMRNALVNEFAQVADADLADQEKTGAILKTFVARNKAVILDQSGHGAGMRPSEDPAAEVQRIEAQTPEQRRADLKKSGVL